MFCDSQIQDARTTQQLNTTLKYVASEAHINEYDRNLNGMSAEDLIQRFAKNVERDMENDRNNLANQQYQGNSDYTIVPINSFEEASKYGKYTSWCVTHDASMFNSYTHDGIGQFYFCLKRGFESAPQQEGEGCPLDEYGLSMVAVSVNETGALSTCTCRWNHDNEGNDNIMDTKQISQLIGRNFYEVFKPNNKWQTLLDDCMRRLRKGEDPEDVFDWVGIFQEGLAVVKLSSKTNWIDTDGNLFSPNQWFDFATGFHKGLARVRLNGRYNWIDREGNLLSSNQWFDEVDVFFNGYAVVELNKFWNWIDTEGNILFPNQWFNRVSNFINGYALVKLNRKWYNIDKEGNFYDYSSGQPLGKGVNDIRNFHLESRHHGKTSIRPTIRLTETRLTRLIAESAREVLAELALES